MLFTAQGGRTARNRRWKTVCPRLCVESAAGDHFSMLSEPHAKALAERLGRFLQECDEEGKP